MIHIILNINWIHQSINNPPFLNDNNVLKNISVGLFEQIKQKDEQIVSLKTQILDKDTQITSLQSNFSKEHTMFIVCYVIVAPNIK